MILKIKDELKKLINRIPENKRPFAAILFAFSLIFLIAIPEILSTDKSNKSEENIDGTKVCEQFVTQTEDRLCSLISSIEGAGKTKVMLTLESGEENIYACDINDDKTEYVVIKANSDETGLLLKIVKPKIRGVAVVCEGGESAVVRRDIINAVSSSLGISSTKISIAKMKEGALK